MDRSALKIPRGVWLQSSNFKVQTVKNSSKVRRMSNFLKGKTYPVSFSQFSPAVVFWQIWWLKLSLLNSCMGASRLHGRCHRNHNNSTRRWFIDWLPKGPFPIKILKATFMAILKWPQLLHSLTFIFSCICLSLFGFYFTTGRSKLTPYPYAELQVYWPLFTPNFSYV